MTNPDPIVPPFRACPSVACGSPRPLLGYGRGWRCEVCGLELDADGRVTNWEPLHVDVRTGTITGGKVGGKTPEDPA